MEDSLQGFSEANAENQLAATVNDPKVSSQWGLSAVGAGSAWNYAKSNGAVTVAVIDSGVDYDHPDLAANLILGSYAKNTYTGSTGASAVDDEIGHGTHVAGIISAVADNSVGVAGVSFNAKILPIKTTFGTAGNMYSSDVVEAIEYVISLKQSASSPRYLKDIRVINLSLGGYTYSSTYAAAVAKARAADIFVAAAAGNDAKSSSFYPAAYSGALGVSALKNSSGYLQFDSSYSNYGSYVDIAAPGTSIYSTVLSGSYGYKSGTSMATPMVSGAAALLFSIDSAFTAEYVDTLLMASATDLGASGRDNYYGYGALNLSLAASAASNDIIRAQIQPIPDQTYTGNEIRPNVVVTFGEKTLVEGTDYTVTYSNNVNAGTATARVKGIGSYWDVQDLSFTIHPKEVASSDVVIAGIPAQTYTGKEIKPQVSISTGGKPVSCTVEYSNNVNVGTASFVALFTGNYTGSARGTFAIAPKPIAPPQQQEDVIYNGQEQHYTATGEGYSVIRE